MKIKAPSASIKAMIMDILMLVICLLFFGFLLLAPTAFADTLLTPEEEALWQAYQSGEIIRLHVVANSDSPQDQQVKLQVRDALLLAFGEALAGCETADEAYAKLKQQTAAMEDAARQAAHLNGFTDTVFAEVGLLELPQKTYGQVTLPAGSYRGLRVTLGSGAGQNWWCILFPQLCLAAADESPWQSQPAPGIEAPLASTLDSADDPTAVALSDELEVTWGAQQIFAYWPLYVPDSSMDAAAAPVVDPVSNQ